MGLMELLGGSIGGDEKLATSMLMKPVLSEAPTEWVLEMRLPYGGLMRCTMSKKRVLDEGEQLDVHGDGGAAEVKCYLCREGESTFMELTAENYRSKNLTGVESSAMSFVRKKLDQLTDLIMPQDENHLVSTYPQEAAA